MEGGKAVQPCFHVSSWLEPLKLTALSPVSTPPRPLPSPPSEQAPWPRTRAHGRLRCVIAVARSENGLRLLAIIFFIVGHLFPFQANCSKQPDSQVSGRVPPTVCRDS